MLAVTAVAAIVAASISQLPPSTGAPLLAFVATAVAAVVVTAAVTSRGIARTFHVGAAIPLLILLLRTALVFAALVEHLSFVEPDEPEPDPLVQQYGDFFGAPWVKLRISYRWEAAYALASAPLIGLLCAALQWLRERSESRAEMPAGASSRWRWVPIALLTVLVVAAIAVGIRYKTTHVQHGAPADADWDAHDGSAVPRSGTPVDLSTVLSAGDKVLVHQGVSWWRGRVLEVFDDGEVKVRYVGWGSNWDEKSVPRSRLRLP